MRAFLILENGIWLRKQIPLHEVLFQENYRARLMQVNFHTAGLFSYNIIPTNKFILEQTGLLHRIFWPVAHTCGMQSSSRQHLNPLC